MTNLLTFISIFVLSWLGVGIFRKWSENRSILDVPNERSSHDKPTPVGGGLVIVVFTLLPLLACDVLNVDGVGYWGFYVGVSAVAIISWIDDLKTVPAALRFSVHILCALIVVIQVGGFPELLVWPGNSVNLGLIGTVIAVVWIVWMTNAYNFMDGIDGLAGTQAVVAAASWALFAAFNGPDLLLYAAILVMATSLGFLLHNWPPATVFMGDVGSAFLGFSFGVFPLIALSSVDLKVERGSIPVIAAAFVWLFFADTVVTLLRRAINGETVWNPHRKHLYQEMIKAGNSHLRVTLLYGTLMIIVAAAALTEMKTQIFGLTAGAGISVLIVIAGLVLSTKRNSKDLGV